MLAVTGSTGQLGGRVAARLAKLGITQRLIVRDPSRVPQLPNVEVKQISSYGDAVGMGRALVGVETLFLVAAHDLIAFSRHAAGVNNIFKVSTDSELASARHLAEKEDKALTQQYDRLQQHAAAIYAAAAMGVERIVYISFMSAAPDATFLLARDHFHTEEMIRGTGLNFTFLRMSLYADRVAGHCSNDGVIRGPAGEGRAAWVTRDDIADVAVSVLTGSGHDRCTYDITGPEAITMRETAERLSYATGQRIIYQPQTPHEARTSRTTSGIDHYDAERLALTGRYISDQEVETLISHYLQIATGELATVSDTVPKLTGHPAQSLAEYLQKHPESYQHLIQG
jgi:NAD(P)H dehydrogenase (quinone)